MRAQIETPHPIAKAAEPKPLFATFFEKTTDGEKLRIVAVFQLRLVTLEAALVRAVAIQCAVGSNPDKTFGIGVDVPHGAFVERLLRKRKELRLVGRQLLLVYGEHAQATCPSAKPEVALAVLGNAVDAFGANAAGARVQGIVAQELQLLVEDESSGIGACPQTLLLIPKQVSNGARRYRALLQYLREAATWAVQNIHSSARCAQKYAAVWSFAAGEYKVVVEPIGGILAGAKELEIASKGVETIQSTTVGSNPDNARAVLARSPYHVAAQRIFAVFVVLKQLALARFGVETAKARTEGAEPQNALMVDGDGRNGLRHFALLARLALHGADGHFVQIDLYQTSIPRTHPQLVVFVFGNTGNCAVGEIAVLAGKLPNVFACGVESQQAVLLGANPERPAFVGMKCIDAQETPPIELGHGFELPRSRTKTLQTAAVETEPQIALGIFVDGVYVVVGIAKAISPRRIIALEAIGFGEVSVQTVFGGHPQSAVAGLENRVYRLMREALRIAHLVEILAKAVGIVSIQPVEGANPKETLVVLKNTVDMVLRKPIAGA